MMIPVSADTEQRAATIGLQDNRIVGYAIVFDRPSVDLGGFTEIIRPGAVDRTFAEGIDVRALVDHRPDKIIGRVKANTLRLEKDAHGLRVSIDPPDTTVGRDVLESVRRGDVSGMSFRFSVVRPHGERFETRSGTPTRIISDMRVHEVSVVTFPAYEATDVTVAQRSLQAFQQAHSLPLAMWQRRHRVRLT
jgi:uncharacterized protein